MAGDGRAERVRARQAALAAAAARRQAAAKSRVPWGGVGPDGVFVMVPGGG